VLCAAGIWVRLNFCTPHRLRLVSPAMRSGDYIFLTFLFSHQIFSTYGASTSVPTLMAAYGGFFSTTLPLH
jgi:hypothetical protein